MSLFSRKTVTIFIVILSIVLITAFWVIFKLIKFHENNDQVVVYTDSLAFIADTKEFQCIQSSTVALDINDYSYNVLEKPLATPIYKYTSILDAEPPVHIHILAMQAGSGRVIVEKSVKPIWLVLLSSQPGIWHIEQAPGANIEKVITNHVVREIRFTNTLSSSLTNITNYVLNRTPAASIPPEIVVIPKNRCFLNFTHFQKYNLRKTFVRSLSNIRNWLGHPELSFQSIKTPSYFKTTFKVPFIKAPRSEKRLARIQKLSEPIVHDAYNKTNQVRHRDAIDTFISQYENMPRKDNIEAITFSTVTSFLDTLAEYRKQKLLPSSFPHSNISGTSGVMAWYDFANYRNAYTKYTPSGETKDACKGSRNRKFLVIEGTNDTNIVKCSWGNQLYFMKDGNDHIDDSWGDDIIYAGPGDDIIDAHWGNDLIFFNYGWGQDTINKTCTFSAFIPQDSAKAKKVYWNKQWPYKNFIVFGKDIRKEDMVSINGKLVHKLTGDSITIKGDCFNLIYWQ